MSNIPSDEALAALAKLVAGYKGLRRVEMPMPLETLTWLLTAVRELKTEVLAERERCAKLCDDLAAEFERQSWQEAEDACNDCAAAIRRQPK